MRATLKYFCSIVFISLSFLFFSSADLILQKSDNVLDGKTFDVVIEAQEGTKKLAIPLKDNLTFKEGIFNTAYMQQFEKFPASVYHTTTDSTSMIVTFKSQSQNKQKDNIAWTGKINGETIEGTAIIFHKKTKDRMEYSFTGKLRKKK